MRWAPARRETVSSKAKRFSTRRGLVALTLKRWKRLSGLRSDLSLSRAGGSKGFEGEEVVVAVSEAAAAAKWQSLLRVGRRESMIRGLLREYHALGVMQRSVAFGERVKKKKKKELVADIRRRGQSRVKSNERRHH